MLPLFNSSHVSHVPFRCIHNPTVLFTRALVDIMIDRELTVKYRDSGFRKDCAKKFTGLDFFVRDKQLCLTPIIFLLSLIVSIDPYFRDFLDANLRGRVPFIQKILLEHVRTGDFKGFGSLDRNELSLEYYSFLKKSNLENTILDPRHLRKGNEDSVITFLLYLSNYKTQTSDSKQDGYVKTTPYRFHNYFAHDCITTTGMTCSDRKYLLWHPHCSFKGGRPQQLNLLLCNLLNCRLKTAFATLPFDVSHSNSYVEISHSDELLAQTLVDLVLFGDDSSDDNRVEATIVDDSPRSTGRPSSSRKNRVGKDLKYTFKVNEPFVDKLTKLITIVNDLPDDFGDRLAFQS